MNRVILIGRLTKDIDFKALDSGTTISTFTLAVDRFKKGEADFIPIVVFGKQAENAAQYLHKGSLCAVDGRLQVRNYDAKDGTKRYVTEVIAESVRFLDSKKSDDNTASPNNVGKEIVFSDDDVAF